MSSDLPLRRVVVYRNGVGYFERSGAVDADQVTFRMRGTMVGDFLATLAIVERGGGSVRSASFPLEIKDEERPAAAPPPEYRGMLKPWPNEMPGPKKDPKKLRDVTLSLDGKEHDLSIGYVAETPVWRPSYRVVVQQGGQADLQTWGIVQNLSGEDWKDVELVLVAGAPIAFQSTLGTPVVPLRPTVNDSGEIITAVPTGETTLAQAPEAPPAPPSPEPVMMAEREEAADDDAAPADAKKRLSKGDSLGASGYGRGGGGMANKAAAPRASMARQSAAPMPMAPGMPAGQSIGGDISAPRRMSALAAVALEGGTTRYGLPDRVTVPDESATMVLLVHERVPGGAVFLFAPDPGVPDSASHPFRVVRFTNATKGLLERGPIAVFEKGSFLGEGVLEPLPPKATATVPFALERGLGVTSETKYEQLGARILKIEAGELWIERDQVRKTTYKVQSGSTDAAHLLVKHPRSSEMRLFQPPPGTEDNTGAGSALVPLDLAAFGAGSVTVDERSPNQQPADWMGPLAEIAVKAYFEDTRSDPKVVAALRQAWAIRDKLRGLYDERDKLSVEQNEIQTNMNETRLSLRALEKNRKAADLVAKLTERLRQGTDRLDAITKRLIEVELAVKEQEVRFRDASREITLVNLPGPKAGS